MNSETTLKIGKGRSGFSLPLELVTSTQAILARKRSGKSYLASVQAEELLEHGQQVIVFDPTSAWYGLRSSASGDGVGFPIVVFGGDHEDAPLDFHTGKAMAAAVIEHGFSAIFDIGNLHTEEQVQFVMDFSSELLRINRSALHVFMDEADTFAPQKPLGFLQNKCLGTVSRLVKQGGIRGVGFTMITQRPASMNKDVLSQVDILTVLRMSHPLDIKAATDWIKSEVTVDFAKEVEKALPGLPVGTAYFCSASLGLGERVEVRARHTFNSGATPKPGERKAEPKVMYGIDIEKLGKEISASVQRTKEESPEYLKKRIANLEAQIAKGGTVDMGFIEEAQAAQAELESLRVQVVLIPDLQGQVQAWEQRVKMFALRMDEMCHELVTGMPPITVVLPTPLPVRTHRVAEAVLNSPSRPSPSKDGGLQSRILRALAEFESIGRKQLPRNILSAWSEAKGGYFNDTLSKMKTGGLLEYPSGGFVALSAEGRQVAPKVSRPVSASAFFEAVVAQAGGGLNERIMRRLHASLPDGLSRDELSEAVDAKGGYFNDTLSRLKSAGFLEYPNRGSVRLQAWTVMK